MNKKVKALNNKQLDYYSIVPKIKLSKQSKTCKPNLLLLRDEQEAHVHDIYNEYTHDEIDSVMASMFTEKLRKVNARLEQLEQC